MSLWPSSGARGAAEGAPDFVLNYSETEFFPGEGFQPFKQKFPQENPIYDFCVSPPWFEPLRSVVCETVTHLEQRHFGGQDRSRARAKLIFTKFQTPGWCSQSYSAVQGGPGGAFDDPYGSLPSPVLCLQVGGGAEFWVYPAFSLSVVRARSSLELSIAVKCCFHEGLSAPVSLV